MLRRLILTLGVLMAVAAPAMAQTTAADDGGKTGFAIITPKGYVTVPADNAWKVLAVQTKMPVAILAFALPDDSADGSADSVTNLAVTLNDTATPEGQRSFAVYGGAVDGQVPVKESHGAWTVYSQDSTYDGTDYTVIDATAHIADVDVGARISWPHLADHPAGYDDAMRTLFLAELDDIGGDLGAFPMPQGAVARRPAGQ